MFKGKGETRRKNTKALHLTAYKEIQYVLKKIKLNLSDARMWQTSAIVIKDLKKSYNTFQKEKLLYKLIRNMGMNESFFDSTQILKQIAELVAPKDFSANIVKTRDFIRIKPSCLSNTAQS